MKWNELIRQTEKILNQHSPNILTAIGVSGTVTTAYLAGKASYASALVILGHENAGHYEYGERVGLEMTAREKVELVWKLYIPATLSGTATVICIVGANRVGSRRTAALTAAYSLSERAFVEYRDKVVEVIGEKKEKTVRDELVKDKIRDNPPSKEILISGPGNVLCCELYTGRYFSSDMETLRRSQNDINAKLLAHEYASLSDFYYMIGLPYTSTSDNSGWSSDKQLELSFTTVMAEDGRPCLAFDYNYIQPF